MSRAVVADRAGCVVGVDVQEAAKWYRPPSMVFMTDALM